jgi:phytoene dehydrogenase-like protein
MAPPLIIGAGPNGLTAAFYLAKAGLKPLVLERRSIVGGGVITEEFAPGYRAPLLSHVSGPLRPSIVRDMGLARRGVTFVEADPRLVALGEDGRALAFSTDVGRTAAAIRAFSEHDAGQYADFCRTMTRLGAFLAHLLESTPPSLSGTPAEVWDLLKIGRRFRALGRPDAFRLLRWGPMAAGDLVSEWFETERLQAVVAARGIFGASQGPWSAGTSAALLLHAAIDPAPGGSTVTTIGGPGALTRAMREAAREAGADIRTDAEVVRVLVRHGRVTGVALADGSEHPASAVISSADPKSTLLGLIDPLDLDPGFVTKVRNYRARGAAATVTFALSGLPAFRGVANPADLAGRIHIGPSLDYLEQAFDASKYGEISRDPYLDVVIPTIGDPGLAPAGRHVLSAHVQFAPYSLAGGEDWNSARDRLLSNTLRTLERYAPGLNALVEHHHVVTPLDLERTYGFTGGHIHHGELSLDQLFTMRPILGWAQYRTPIEGLYLCGAGTHPGGALTGGSGQNAAREIAGQLKSAARSTRGR